nr:polynucleotide adenylyltransferase family protein [Tanacetum cinerariifolium]
LTIENIVCITSQVRTAFSRCEIVGKRFPIFHVHVGDDIVEVSSFSTPARHHFIKSGISLQRHDDCDEMDHSRWRNCMERDLTING